MYAAFFGLAREPFSLAPDPRFLFLSERHREALAHLVYGVRGSGGFVLLTGEIGAGKTTVVRGFLEQLPAHCVVAYVFNPALSALELLQTLCAEFGLPPREGEAHGSLKAHVDALNAFLLTLHAQGRQALVVVDEAQALRRPLLEQLRLLTNLETAERKLLQIVLVGQPELQRRIASAGLEQLAQRVVARYHLGALSELETAQYVEHRLAVAGAPGAAAVQPYSLFERAALRQLHRYSGGVPRRINLLADRALLGAYGQGQRQVSAALVAQAAGEVMGQATRHATRWRRPALLAAGLTTAALLAAGLTFMWNGSPPSGSATLAQAGAPNSTAAASAAAPALPLPVVAAAPSAPAYDDPAPLLAQASADEAQAWRELSLHWKVAVGEGEPCAVLRQAELACFRSSTGGLALLRTLARPALLVLRDAQGQRRHALLVALGPEEAVFEVAGERSRLALPALARVWRGEFMTLWHTPPGWAGGSSTAALRAWAAPRLDAALPGSAVAQDFATRVAAFQLLHGLPADGQVGPLTVMLLSRRGEPGAAPDPVLGKPGAAER